MPSITFRALCDFRDARAAEFSAALALLSSIPNKGSDAYFIAVDTALRAAEDCNAAHAELTNHSGIAASPNPHSANIFGDLDFRATLLERCGVSGCASAIFAGGVWEPEFIEACRAALGTRAEEAYQRAEAAIEDRALLRFHYDAFGEGCPA